MAMSLHQKKVVIVASASVALGVGLYYLLATRNGKKLKRRASVTVTKEDKAPGSPVAQPEVEKEVVRPFSQLQEQTDPPRDVEVIVPSVGVGQFGNESPTSSFVTVEKEDCHGSEDGGKERSEPLVADENYFESFSHTDTVVTIKADKDEPEGGAVTNVGDSESPPGIVADVADTSASSVVGHAVAESVLDSMIDSVTFDTPSLSEINTLGKHDLTWVPENDIDDVFSGQMSSLKEDDDTIWSHSVTETVSSSISPRGNFSLVGKVVEEDEEAEESPEQKVYGGSPTASEVDTNVLESEDATKF